MTTLTINTSHAVAGGRRSVLSLGAEPIDDFELGTLRQRLLAGGRVLVAVAPDATPASLAALRTLAPVEVGDELLRPAEDNPLLADSQRRATFLADGSMLDVDHVRPLCVVGAIDHRVLAVDTDGAPIAVELDVDGGLLTVLGTTSLLEDRWLTYPANAAFLAALLGAEVSVVERSATTAVGHRRPPRLDVPAGWLPADRVPTDRGELVRAAGHLGRLLPPEVHDALVDFADCPDPSGALLLRGLPLGQIPPTPPTPTTAVAKDLTSELVLLTVARRLGQPVGYLPEHGGTLIQNICPTPSAVDRQVSTSSSVDLMFHTEAAFHPHRPRFLLLLCLRGDPDGAARTTVASIRELLEDLPPRTRRVLFEPRFGPPPTRAMSAPARPDSVDRSRCSRASWEAPNLVFDADLMVGTDDEATAALRTLAELVGRRHTGVVLTAGDLLVVDNSIAVHGRSPFRARFDGSDRWLQRVFVVGDLVPSAGERNGRVITTRFAP